jgi:DNA-binding response OmpR family regulator
MVKNTVINQESQCEGRILIIDDEKDIAFILKRGLENDGFKVDTFNDPSFALTNFRAGSYDIIVTDIRMPKMNGFELYREIRKVDSKVRICFLTAFEVHYNELKRILPSIDTRHFIKKPVSIASLVRIVRRELKGE